MATVVYVAGSRCSRPHSYIFKASLPADQATTPDEWGPFPSPAPGKTVAHDFFGSFIAACCASFEFAARRQKTPGSGGESCVYEGLGFQTEQKFKLNFPRAASGRELHLGERVTHVGLSLDSRTPVSIHILLLAHDLRNSINDSRY